MASAWAPKRLSFDMKLKFWTLVFILALLRTRFNLFHGRTDGDVKLETQGSASISTQINFATLQPPMHGSLECFSHDVVESLISPDNMLSGEHQLVIQVTYLIGSII